MKQEQKEVLQDIGKIQKNQGLLLENATSCQQQFFQCFAQRKLLNKQMLHRKIDQVLEYLPGSFSRVTLQDLYISVCLEMKVELNPEDLPMLKRLIEWSDAFPQLKKERILPLLEAVAPQQNNDGFNSYEEYLTYLNLVAGDLIKLIRGSNKPRDQSEQRYLKAVNPDDLIAFLMGSLPKVLYNIILPNEVLPPEHKRENQSMEILFRVPSFEYFVRSKHYYATLIKLLVKMLMKVELKQFQQKIMMEIVFRYFYAYHYDKRYGATDIFIQAYNNLHESVRYALADQFVLFLKIVRKIGKNKFVEFLLNKSQWLKEINSKVATDNYVGYVKQTLVPFPGFRIPEVIKVPSGKIENRYFEILQDFSLFYFMIQVPSKDINLRLYYLGDFTDLKPSRTELLFYQKRSGMVKANIMAVKRGIYMFEFDNSYSWINSKIVKFETIVLAPVQFSSVNQHSWLNSFYDNLPLNKMGDKSQVILIRKVLPPKAEIHYEGAANITKIKGWYNLKLGKGTDMYEFQTQSEDKLVEKFTQLAQKSGKIKWMVAGELLEETDDLKTVLGVKNKSQQKEQEKTEVKMMRYGEEKNEVEIQSSSTSLNVQKEREEKPSIPKEEKKESQE